MSIGDFLPFAFSFDFDARWKEGDDGGGKSLLAPAAEILE